MQATVQRRYNAGAIALHWPIALLILTNIGLAWWFNTLHGEAKIEPIQLHKSIGITVLLLSVLRLAWRLVTPRRRCRRRCRPGSAGSPTRCTPSSTW